MYLEMSTAPSGSAEWLRRVAPPSGSAEWLRRVAPPSGSAECRLAAAGAATRPYGCAVGAGGAPHGVYWCRSDEVQAPYE
jgi:hypothetical protein